MSDTTANTLQEQGLQNFIEICCFVDTYHIESCLRSDAICWVVKHEDVFFSPFLLQMPANLLSVVTFWQCKLSSMATVASWEYSMYTLCLQYHCVIVEKVCFYERTVKNVCITVVGVNTLFIIFLFYSKHIHEVCCGRDILTLLLYKWFYPRLYR